MSEILHHTSDQDPHPALLGMVNAMNNLHAEMVDGGADTAREVSNLRTPDSNGQSATTDSIESPVATERPIPRPIIATASSGIPSEASSEAVNTRTADFAHGPAGQTPNTTNATARGSATRATSLSNPRQTMRSGFAARIREGFRRPELSERDRRRLSYIAFGDLSVASGHIGEKLEGQGELIKSEVILPNGDLKSVTTHEPPHIPKFIKDEHPLYSEMGEVLGESVDRTNRIFKDIRGFVEKGDMLHLVNSVADLSKRMMEIFTTARTYPTSTKRDGAARKIGMTREEYAAKMYQSVIQRVYDEVMSVEDMVPERVIGDLVFSANGEPHFVRDGRDWSRQFDIQNIRQLRNALAARAEQEGKLKFLGQKIETGCVMRVGRSQVYPDIMARYLGLEDNIQGLPPYADRLHETIPHTVIAKVNFLLALADREARFDRGEKDAGTSVIRLDLIDQRPIASRP